MQSRVEGHEVSVMEDWELADLPQVSKCCQLVGEEPVQASYEEHES